MNARLRLSLLTTVVVVLGVLVVLVLARPGSSDAGSASGIEHAGTPFAGATRPGAASPPFRLRDQDGRLTSIAEFRGSPVIVTFMYSTCTDTCPATARQIASALDTLHKNVPTVIVSVDPKGDTPGSVQRFLNKMNLRDRAHFVIGTRAQLAPIWKAYAIQPQGAGFDHSANVLVLDAQGRQRVSFPVDTLTSDGLAHDVLAVQQRFPATTAATPSTTSR